MEELLIQLLDLVKGCIMPKGKKISEHKKIINQRLTITYYSEPEVWGLKHCDHNSELLIKRKTMLKLLKSVENMEKSLKGVL